MPGSCLGCGRDLRSCCPRLVRGSGCFSFCAPSTTFKKILAFDPLCNDVPSASTIFPMTLFLLGGFGVMVVAYLLTIFYMRRRDGVQPSYKDVLVMATFMGCCVL